MKAAQRYDCHRSWQKRKIRSIKLAVINIVHRFIYVKAA